MGKPIRAMSTVLLLLPPCAVVLGWLFGGPSSQASCVRPADWFGQKRQRSAIKLEANFLKDSGDPPTATRHFPCLGLFLLAAVCNDCTNLVQREPSAAEDAAVAGPAFHRLADQLGAERTIESRQKLRTAFEQFDGERAGTLDVDELLGWLSVVRATEVEQAAIRRAVSRLPHERISFQMLEALLLEHSKLSSAVRAEAECWYKIHNWLKRQRGTPAGVLASIDFDSSGDRADGKLDRAEMNILLKRAGVHPKATKGFLENFTYVADDPRWFGKGSVLIHDLVEALEARMALRAFKGL